MVLFWILVVALIAALARIATLDATAQVSREEFLQCLATVDDPGVLLVHHKVLWLIGAARYRYVTSFRGLRIHARSFQPLELPPEVAVINTWKL